MLLSLFPNPKIAIYHPRDHSESRLADCCRQCHSRNRANSPRQTAAPLLRAARNHQLEFCMLLKKAIEVAQFHIVRSFSGFETPTEPHFDPASINKFRELLSSCESYVEFGTGGSTIVADELNKPCFAVESDSVYAKAVRAGLSGGTSVHIEDVDIGLIGPWSVPLFRKLNPTRQARWLAYPDAPFKNNGAFYDFALIDGRFRVACALATALNAQQSSRDCTIMFDDYRDRPHYHWIEEFLGRPEMFGRAGFFYSKNFIKDVDRSMVIESAKDFR